MLKYSNAVAAVEPEGATPDRGADHGSSHHQIGLCETVKRSRVVFRLNVCSHPLEAVSHPLQAILHPFRPCYVKFRLPIRYLDPCLSIFNAFLVAGNAFLTMRC